MKKLNLFFIASLLFAYACTPALTPVPSPPPGKMDILVKVHVLTDSPASGSEYERKEGEPQRVGVYEFYLKKPGVPGSGAFKKLDSIPLKKINTIEFYGEKRVTKTSGALCVGYPATNIIDGKACVEIDQSKDGVETTVHYWETSLGILR